MNAHALIDAYARANANASYCYIRLRELYEADGWTFTTTEGHDTAKKAFRAAWRSWCHYHETGEIKQFKP